MPLRGCQSNQKKKNKGVNAGPPNNKTSTLLNTREAKKGRKMNTMNILSKKELNTLESSIKEYIEQIVKVGKEYNRLNDTAYSYAYIHGFRALGDPSYYLELEGEEFWKELLTECVYPAIWIQGNTERDFCIHLVEKSVGYKNLMCLMENFKDKEGFRDDLMDAFLRRYKRGE